MTIAFDRAQADVMVERLRALAQPQRLMILAVLLKSERAVSEIEAHTGIVQPALSQQLAELRRNGVVATRREARLIYYRIIDDEMAERVRALFDAFGTSPGAAPSARTKPPRRTHSARPIGAASFARIG